MRPAKLTTILATLILPLLCSFALAQSPEEIEEGRAVAVVKAVQAGNADALLELMYENWIPAERGGNRADRWPRIAADLTERHAGLSIVGVDAAGPHELTISTEQSDEPSLQFIFEFETDAPYRVIQMGIEAGGGGGDDPQLPPPDLSEAQNDEALAEALDRWFTDLAKQEIFSGTALIARNGIPIFSGAWGLANRAWNAPNTLDTRFDLGSINKSFTKVAIAQLHAAGQLGFDDTIAEHLPDYPNQEVAHSVNIRHLLDHSAGLGDIFTEKYFNSSKALYRGPRDFFPLFASKEPEFAPGTRSSYSNAGFMVLGAIIESISGLAYDEYVAQNIFNPAGMKNAGFFAKYEPIPNVAVGYTRMRPDGHQGELRNNLYKLPIRGNSAGSAQATAHDLLQFDNALREHKLLLPAYTSWYFGGREPDPDAQSETSGKRATVGTGIAGGAPGVSAVLESDGDLAVIVLANMDMPVTEIIARALFRPLKRALKDAGN
jgi:CubicO group peptidase (beta-lactamase class C family)